MDDFKRKTVPGNGGYKCPCCGPSDGDDKRKWRRRASARLKLSDLLEQCNPDLPLSEEDYAWLNSPPVGAELI